MKEIDFNPSTMTRATQEDIERIYFELWGVELQTKEDSMNNATKPIELQNAITAADEAWAKYDEAIDAGASVAERQQLWNVVNCMEERKGQMYTAWQNAGGTSDIECVTFDATLHAEDFRFKKLGGYVKPTRNANGHTDTIQTAIDKGQLDANGHMLPYKATGRVGGSWDNHEVHSYTADGE